MILISLMGFLIYKLLDVSCNINNKTVTNLQKEAHKSEQSL